MNWAEMVERDLDRLPVEVLMKVAEWSNIRRQLKRDFERQGITRCEMCGSDWALGFAHRVKRRFLVTDAEKRTVALLCQPCHARCDEQMSHAEMFQTISRVIEKRCTTLETA